MFDYLFINTNKLPVSEEEKETIGDKPGWQTKDFDCELTEIYITDEGELKINRFEMQIVPKEERPYPNGKGLEEFVGSMRRTNQRLETIPFHGCVNFYSDIKGQWYEFNAKFTDGKLQEIERYISRYLL